MNIITHLHNRVTSVVHAEDKSPAKALLLEDFYSIVLTRMSDRKEYNALTNDDKMSGQKLTLYKLFHIVSWNDDDPAETIVNNLVMEHDLNKTIVKSLLKEATPLIFSEIRTLANGQKTPDYLQSLLTNPETSFVTSLPEWAFVLFPIATENKQLVSKINIAHAEKQKGTYQPVVLSEEDAEFIKQQKALDKKKAESKKAEQETATHEQQEITKKEEEEQKELEKQELEKKEREQKELEKREREQKEREQKELEKREREQKEREQKELEKREREQKEREQKELEKREREQKEREQKELEKQTLEKKEIDNRKTTVSQQKSPPVLPPPVPAKETAEGYENIVVDEDDDNDSNATTSSDNTGTIQKLMPIVGIILVGIIMWALLRGCQSDSDTTPTNEQAQTTDSTSTDSKTAPSIQLSTDSSSKLQDVEVIVNNANSADNIENILKENFADFQPKEDNIQLDEERNKLIINEETFEKLLALLKNNPDTSMSIVGNDLKITNEDDKKQKQLLNEAQKILAKFNSKADDNSQKLTINGKAVKVPKDDIAVIKEDNEKTKPAEINVEEEVENSINASKKALNNLNGKPDVKVIEDALNTQIFNFAVNDNQIPKANKPILNKASELLKQTNARIRITGHTDSDGDEKYNKRLSEDRSFAVKKYLMIQGLPSASIIAEGVGESKPIDSNDTEVGKFHNRRIEFKITEIEAE